MASRYVTVTHIFLIPGPRKPVQGRFIRQKIQKFEFLTASFVTASCPLRTKTSAIARDHQGTLPIHPQGHP